VKPTAAWLQRITGLLPAARIAEPGLPEQISAYVSSTVVALAHARFDGDSEGDLEMSLRADPMTQLTELRSTIELQMRALQLHRSPARKSANLVLAPEMYNLSLVDRPDVPEADVSEAVRWLIQDQVDYPMEGASLDVFNLPRSASRERPMVFAVSVQTDLLRSMIREINAAGLQLASIDATELTLRNLIWQCFPHADQNIALLRLTSNSGLIDISRADELYLARRISGVPEEFSETKWEDFRERMLLQVQRSIDYYESAMNQPHCNMLVVACTDDWSTRVTGYLAEMLPIPVRTVAEVLADELKLTLYNPEVQPIDWAELGVEQTNAIAAGLPALGGVLRHQIARALADAA
jgi:hypothetical protein